MVKLANTQVSKTCEVKTLAGSIPAPGTLGFERSEIPLSGTIPSLGTTLESEMANTEKLKCTISGSFKYKPEIDLARDEFSDRGFIVLAPGKGWLVHHSNQPYQNPKTSTFRPLPGEKYMDLKAVEDSFLENITRSDFLYVLNPEGYLGNSTCLEIGFAIARGIPVFLAYPVSRFVDLDPIWAEIIAKLEVISIKDLAKKLQDSTSADQFQKT